MMVGDGDGGLVNVCFVRQLQTAAAQQVVETVLVAGFLWYQLTRTILVFKLL